MSENKKKFDSKCGKRCESSLRDCLESREDESICRMKHAQCSCGCILES